MKSRFFEILNQHCDEWGQTLEGIMDMKKRREQPKPMIKAFTIRDYLEEYPKTSLKVIAGWLGYADHSTINHLLKAADTFIYNPKSKDYSSFVSFGYENKIRFKHKYVSLTYK